MAGYSHQRTGNGRQCLLDLLGVAASGTRTSLSRIIREHALDNFSSRSPTSGSRLLSDGRHCSPAGATLANGMTIDSVDAHDGYKPCKGHTGCGVLPATIALLEHKRGATEQELLTCLVIGYEIACRAGVALHGSVSDFSVSDIQLVVVGTFHESYRLATASPTTTEEAQYSLPFPVAAALVHKRITVNEIDRAGLHVKRMGDKENLEEFYSLVFTSAE